ncbi:hypothetical protein BO70DRAFT_171951 [Aspergillus heteromorphus CBS 117.55]|uniref:Uncharacterized protein n=1 Tax=Aspergillus heteromorphus CBS 117.55 TaxID=1448321 RepID=A0A317V3J9_9EURO|nr:uncharacterized protein BO70DRAFT_171951 [Aspergillus heteromorphus CBS 117.55]PWY66760.1 hypothetical protein BO70DRAFT_171951 [Aspergillus heteromorphus CBS 117.55]
MRAHFDALSNLAFPLLLQGIPISIFTSDTLQRCNAAPPKVSNVHPTWCRAFLRESRRCFPCPYPAGSIRCSD